MYPFVMRLDIAYASQNITSENQDIYASFCHETNNVFTLQNMSSETQGLYIPF